MLHYKLHGMHMTEEVPHWPTRLLSFNLIRPIKLSDLVQPYIGLEFGLIPLAIDSKRLMDSSLATCTKVFSKSIDLTWCTIVLQAMPYF